MLTIGSRGSQLALWQARHVQSLLAAQGIAAEIEVIRTTGDTLSAANISSVGTKGVFTKEIEDALLENRVHLAVHSLKDLSTALPENLVLAASPARENPHDAIAGRLLADLPAGARIGTSSIRRAAQLRRLRPDLAILPIRGNVDTRLRKLDSGEYDAIVLAAAGLIRLGLADRIAQELPFDMMCPAPGQGALGIETTPHGRGFEAAQTLNHPETWTAITAERAVVESLGGGCQLPVGAIAEISGTIYLTAVVITPDGGTVIRESAEAPVSEARSLGLALGSRLLSQGARKILDEVYSDSR